MLRNYQKKIKSDIYSAWNYGYKNILVTSPAGSGKTVLFSSILDDHNGVSAVVVHRQELICQISQSLARSKVFHRIIGSRETIQLCVRMHILEFGVTYYNPPAQCAVISVNSLIKPKPLLSSWMKSVTLWVVDEAHHLLKDNMWGVVDKIFPNAKGLGVTATPKRADGLGLGRNSNGVFDVLVHGPTMRQLINAGWLCDYRIFSPPNDLILENIPISKKTGDFNPNRAKIEVRKSCIIGNVVSHYQKFTNGKLGITFATDIESAHDIADEFNFKGIPALAISGKTKSKERIKAMNMFKNREILQLVNCDLFGEGVDLPALEVVSMARPTKSLSLYIQQFCRVLRPLVNSDWNNYTDEQRLENIKNGDKPFGTVINHVGNIKTHGLPDKNQYWSLIKKPKRKLQTVSQIKTCPKCTADYNRNFKRCPYCDHIIVPILRAKPEQVDGNLEELSQEVLKVMRGEIEKVDMSVEDFRKNQNQNIAKWKRNIHVVQHDKRQKAQIELREKIALWAGHLKAQGNCDADSYRQFYYDFGLDVLTAQTLKTAETKILLEKINNELISMGN